MCGEAVPSGLHFGKRYAAWGTMVSVSQSREHSAERCRAWNANHAHQVSAGRARAAELTVEDRRRAPRPHPILDGQTVRDMRIAAGLTVRYVAVHVGVSYQAVSQWEKSAYGPPRQRIAPLLALFEQVKRDRADALFSTKAVVQRTGVHASTLRAWELRYGVPAPSRYDGTCHPLYSQRDVACVIRLRQLLEMGIALGSAVALLRAQEQEVARDGTAD